MCFTINFIRLHTQLYFCNWICHHNNYVNEYHCWIIYRRDVLWLQIIIHFIYHSLHIVSYNIFHTNIYIYMWTHTLQFSTCLTFGVTYSRSKSNNNPSNHISHKTIVYHRPNWLLLWNQTIFCQQTNDKQMKNISINVLLVITNKTHRFFSSPECTANFNASLFVHNDPRKKQLLLLCTVLST